MGALPYWLLTTILLLPHLHQTFTAPQSSFEKTATAEESQTVQDGESPLAWTTEEEERKNHALHCQEPRHPFRLHEDLGEKRLRKRSYMETDAYTDPTFYPMMSHNVISPLYPLEDEMDKAALRKVFYANELSSENEVDKRGFGDRMVMYDKRGFGDRMLHKKGFGDRMLTKKGFGDRMLTKKGFGDRMLTKKGFGDRMLYKKGFGDRMLHKKGFGDRIIEYM